MTGRELAELFMFHQMQKPSNERMTIDQAERMIMAFAYDYHESEVKKLNLHVVMQQSEQLFCPNCHTSHYNKEWDGYCCKSCWDGIEAK